MRALGVGGWLVRSGWIDPEVPLVPYLLLTSQNLEGANEASFQLAFVPALFSWPLRNCHNPLLGGSGQGQLCSRAHGSGGLLPRHSGKLMSRHAAVRLSLN